MRSAWNLLSSVEIESAGSWIATPRRSKKTAHASEQERPDVTAQRQAWRATQAELNPQRLVFIDETGASTKMARLCGRSLRGSRCLAAIPHGHWKTTTFVGALRLGGMTAPTVLDGPMDGPAFLAWIEQMLAPTARARRRRRDGQSARPQAGRCAHCDRGHRRNTALPAAIFARSQPNRDGILQVQGALEEGGGADHRGPLDCHCPGPAETHPQEIAPATSPPPDTSLCDQNLL